MHFVRKINYIDGYKISITFNDKKIKIVDIEPYLNKGVFLPLRDPDYFKLVKVRYDTLAWPNEADFCPDVLYEIGVAIPEETKPVPRVRRKKAGEKTQFKYQSTAIAKKVSRKAKI